MEKPSSRDEEARALRDRERLDGPDKGAPTAKPGPARTTRAGQPAIRALARAHAPAAVEALAMVMADSKATPAARVSAASALLNWGYGKAGPGSAERTGARGHGETEQVVRLVWGGERKS